MYGSMSPGQIVGCLIFGVTVMLPGMTLAGFHGGTGWPILGWVCLSFVGGLVGGLLMTPNHRIAGAVGGFIAAPMGLLALYFYAKDRNVMYRAEAAIVTLVACLPGIGVYFVLRLMTDLMFPARPADDYDDEEEDERPRRKRIRRDDDDEDDDDRPRSRRRVRDDEDDEDERPRKRRRDRDDDDDRPRRRERRDDDDD